MIRAHGRRVIVRPFTGEEVSPGGIILEHIKEKPTRGIVLSVGDIEGVQVGDEVVYTLYGGTDIEHEGETLQAVMAENLLAVLGPEGASA